VNRQRNNFQQLMKRWDGDHPYNAIHGVRLTGGADADKLSRAAGDELRDSGISRLIEGPGDWDYRLEPSPEPVPVTVLEPATEAEAAFAALAQLELNRAFDETDQRFPIRLFVIPLPQGHVVALSYRHWVADGWTIAYLLHCILCRYVNETPASEPAARDWNGPGYGPVFKPHLSFGRSFSLVYRMTQMWQRLRTCYAPRAGDKELLGVEVLMPRLSDDTLPRLLAFAKRREVTVNDVFLAAIAEGVGRGDSYRLRRERRHDLALSSILDLRFLAGDRLAHTAGVYLGWFTAVCRSQDVKDFDKVLVRIAEQTAFIKRSRTFLRSVVELELGHRAFHAVWQGEAPRYYRKHFPMAGGVSNMRLPPEWFPGPLGARFQGYLRASPAGPMVPLTFSPTSAGGKLQLAFVVRTLGYRKPAIDAIIDIVRSRLANL